MTLQTIALSELKTSKHNPRKHIDSKSLEGLAANILADGVHQNLVVQKNGDGRYEIIAGERRFRALSLLLERGDIETDYPVPVRVYGDLSRDEQHRIATMENVQREALHPVDEADAFMKLVRKGVLLEDIAAKTGMNVLTIKRRLAISGLCKEVKNALREGTLTLAMAEAMTLGDVEAQREILENIENSTWKRFDADDIRDMLTNSRPTKSIAVFPLESYTGTFTCDLFDNPDESYFDDIEQFNQLQDKAVESLIAEYDKQSAWVEVCRDYGWNSWLYDEAEEGEESGTVIHYNPRRKLEIHTGLVRHETVYDTPTEDVKPKEKPEYSKPALAYMAEQKSLAVQAALLAHPRKAKEIAVVSMITYERGISLQIHSSITSQDNSESSSSTFEVIKIEAERFKEMFGDDMQWLSFFFSYENPVNVYRKVKTLSDEQLESLYCFLVVLSFGQQDEHMRTSGTLFTEIAADLGVSMRDWWQPDREFLNMRRKDQLLAIAQESGASSKWSLQNSKKSEIVAILAKYFSDCRNPDSGLSSEIAAKGQAWCPDAMTFELSNTEEEK